MSSPLDGIKVIDLTIFEAGPTCTLHLAYLGAEVIKVEHPAGGDPARLMWSRQEGDPESWYFVLLNSNKKSVTLDLQHPAAREIFQDLVKAGDVLVENFAPGTMESYGLGYRWLAKINPRIVYASVTGYGLEGPYRNYPCFDIIAQAMGGAISFTGYPDQPPVRCGPSIGDAAGGMNLVAGILAALYQRERTGRGQQVEVSLQDSVVNLCRSFYQWHYSTGRPVPQPGNRVPWLVPWDIFPARDGYVAIAAALELHWQKICKVMGRKDLLDDPRFRTARGRWRNVEEITGIVEEFTRRKRKREVMEQLVREGIPAGAVLNTAEVLEDPHLRYRGTVVEVNHPTRGRFQQIATPIRLSGSRVKVDPSPLLGEHNEAIYGGLLGYSRERIKKLKRRDII